MIPTRTMAEEIKKIVSENPGATGYQIHRELERRSPAAKRFGEGSLWMMIFGPSVGAMYVALAGLENNGTLRSEWGEPKPERGGHRPRHYYVVENK